MNTIEKALAALKPPKTQHNGDTTYAPIEAIADHRMREPERLENTASPMQTAPPGDDTSMLKIPYDALHKLGYLTPALPRSNTAEEFRAIKRPLLNNVEGRRGTNVENANLIMVTSALEGDGKTFGSLNLALSIAMEQNKTVLFIDADVRKATAGNLLGIPSDTPGLIDLLIDDTVEPQDVILRTDMKNLRVLPAGPAHEHATELLASEEMQRLMLELSSRYSDRIIIFDSPPLLLTTEAAVLASFMGQIVFVVAANTTPQNAVKQALEKIPEDKMVGTILNMTPRHYFNFFGMSQGYGYGYGYEYRTKNSADKTGDSHR